MLQLVGAVIRPELCFIMKKSAAGPNGAALRAAARSAFFSLVASGVVDRRWHMATADEPTPALLDK